MDLAARKTHWRDNVEAVGAAIVLALLLKAFALEAYQIPTGSMQPTLMGYTSPTLSVSDRIVVDKFSYQVRDPERFEVAVFRYPLDRSKNYVKRIVGMPNEQLRIANGDVWVRADPSEPWSIARRPNEVQETHWKELARPWTTLNGDIRVEDGDLVARGSGVFRLGSAASIVDRYFDGYPEFFRERIPSSAGGIEQHSDVQENYDVGDLRVAGDAVAAAGTVAIDLVIEEGPHTYRFRLPGPASTSDDRPTIDVTTHPGRGNPVDQRLAPTTTNAAADSAWRLTAERPVRVSAENLDDRLRLRIEGGPTLELDVPPVVDQTSSVRVALTGPGRFEDPEVWRDLYYTRRGTSEWTIPDASYVMLGDNTQNSSDSREWSLERYELLEGGERRILRGNHRQNENALPMGSSTRLFFVDEWGQRRYLDTSSASEPQAPFVAAAPISGEQSAPFVSRELITGRAIAVFWPINLTTGLARVRWVQ